MTKKGKLGRKGSMTREKILNASIEVFSKKGFNGASLSDIAEIAGVNKSDIYNYFDSKQKLYWSILSIYLNDLNEIIKETETQCNNNPENKVKQLISNWLTLLGENPHYAYILRWEFAKGLSCFIELTKSLDENENKPFFMRLYETIQEGVTSGHFSPGTDSVLATASIYNICFGLFFSSEIINSVNNIDLFEAVKTDETLKNYVIDLCLNLLRGETTTQMQQQPGPKLNQ